MAQKTNYAKKWDSVNILIQKGLSRSAIKAAGQIYDLAKKEKETAQQVKALVIKSQLIKEIEEEDWKKNIADLEAEILVSPEPLRQILYNITANIYRSYLQSQRWKIYGRTATVNFNKMDPETWTIEDFDHKINALFSASLTNPERLQLNTLSDYEPILIKGNQRKLRPTLFDLLLHDALDYYRENEISISRPAFRFQLDDSAALSDAKSFIAHSYSGPDVSSHYLTAIRLYQQAIKFHLNDRDAAALIDVNISRLEFANSIGVMQNKAALYKNALDALYDGYSQYPESMQAGSLLAQWWQQKGNDYKAGLGTDKDKMALAEAVRIARNIVDKFPSSEGGMNSKNLLMELQKPALTIITEKVNLPTLAFRSKITFKNIDTAYLRLVKLTPDLESKLTNNFRDDDNYWKRITELKAVRAWKQALPLTGDYRDHSAEMKIDGLPFGKYLLIGSSKANFSLDHNPLATSLFHVSNISYLNSGDEYFLLHRQSGMPLAKAKIQVWKSTYSYDNRRNVSEKSGLVNSDSNGYFKIGNQAGNPDNLRLEISYENDYLFLDDQVSYADHYYASEAKTDLTASQFEEANVRYFIFMDRGIYRPGQPVYFKAIGMTKSYETGKSKLYLPEGKITIYLNDANGQMLDSLSLKANEYGSISGQMSLPKGRLTGQYSLSIPCLNNESTQFFSVEEYKRPKFFVELEKLKGTFRLNDSIQVKGLAQAYAGNKIDGAQVSYRVFRQNRFLYPWIFWSRGIWPPMDKGQKQEITNGKTVTDAAGNFSLVFSAHPDLSIDSTLDPQFDFTIETDVTDLNGETRSKSSAITVSYKSLKLDLTIPGGLLQSNAGKKTLLLEAKNLNDVLLASKVNISIYNLLNPDRLIRERLWEAPDTTVLGADEFLASFPNDAYKNEGDYHTWRRGTLIKNMETTTNDSAAMSILIPDLGAGWYVVEAGSKDQDGNDVKSMAYLSVYDAVSGKMPSQQYQWEQPLKTTAEPGEMASFLQAAGLPNVYVVEQVIRNGDSSNQPGKTAGGIRYDYTTIGSKAEIMNYPVTESDRGGFFVNRFYVVNNRAYLTNRNVNVPWSNKELSINIETFRDKLLPGQEENLKIVIKGHKGEAVAAEMLAAMYDASLDQFKPFEWAALMPWPDNYCRNFWAYDHCFAIGSSNQKYIYEKNEWYDKTYDRIIDINTTLTGKRRSFLQKSHDVLMEAYMSVPDLNQPMPLMMADSMMAGKEREGVEKRETNKSAALKAALNQPKKYPGGESEDIKFRKDFSETAFFQPHLQTDGNGNIELSFKIPEALTQWKLQLLAYSKSLQTALSTRKMVTQKPLMVQSFAPRFLRQGDNLLFSSKIVNLSSEEINGNATLELFNPETSASVDSLFKNTSPVAAFKIGVGQSTSVVFPIEVPNGYHHLLNYRLKAISAVYSDGEEMELPVLTNRMLVTESFPVFLNDTCEKSFVWERFINKNNLIPDKGKQNTLQNHSLTLEFTTNPVWYAVQALPFLMEYPYDCAEQTWNKFYANALASKIATGNPKIKAVFDQWKLNDKEALLSNLQKNQELKSLLIEETPWLSDAQNESKQKQYLAQLFDIVRLADEAKSTIAKLKDIQNPNGSFSWFRGGQEDRYMTQYIICGIGHLKKLKAITAEQQNELQQIALKAIVYLDDKIRTDYENLVRANQSLIKMTPSGLSIQYLYMRSFFKETALPVTVAKAHDYYLEQAKRYWASQPKYYQGMIALVLHRNNEKTNAKSILAALTEKSIADKEFGMYWKEFNNPGFLWWQSPIESHALLIEAYSEIEGNKNRVDQLKTWLLKQKQTQNWKTTKATAEACYAILIQGSDWLNQEKNVAFTLGNINIKTGDDISAEAGTGYFKKQFKPDSIQPEMGKIKIKTIQAIKTKPQVENKMPGWGSIYWQYFEDLDKITTAESPLSISKSIFKIITGSTGPVLTPINDQTVLNIGDKVSIRMELRSNRNLEYVHLKDMRASCFEPINVLSQYKYKNGLGYYESTRDAGTDFFISYLPKGTYVFEYPLVVTHKGQFSNGISTIQCMYAPEFTAHSEGRRISVK